MGQRADEMNGDELRRINNEWSPEDGTPGPEAHDPAEIRAEIEQTRSQMGETIDAIQARLNPQHLGEQVKEQVREQIHEVTATVREATIGRAEHMVRHAGESINEARYGLVETIKQNPIPAAMAAIGLGWLMMNRRSAPRRYERRFDNRYDDRYDDRYERRYATGYYAGEPGYPYRPASTDAYAASGSYYDQERARQSQGLVGRTQDAAGSAVNRAQETVGNVTGQARDAAGNLVEQARDTAGNLVEQARDTAGSVANQAQYQVRRAENTFRGTLDDNPLGMAAVALALGAAVGFGLPQTERENELMGQARDNFVERAQEVAQNTVEKVQQVAGEVATTAEQTAREKAREQGLTGERRTG